MVIHRRIHQQNIVSAFLCRLHIGILHIRIGGIEIHKVAVLVSLQLLYLFAIFVQSKVFLSGVFKQRKMAVLFIEFLIGNHSVFYEEADVLPLFFIAFAIIFEKFSQFVGNLFAAIRSEEPTAAVCLQKTA